MTISLKHSIPADGTFSSQGATAWDDEHVLTQATNKLLGRSTAGTGATEEISIGTGLTLSGGTLTNTGAGSGTVTSVDVSGGTTGLTYSGGPITTSGTITMAGTLAVANGGTGATTQADARTNLGLVIGTNVQAYDADLSAIAALSGTSGLLRKTAADTWSLDTTAYGVGSVTSVSGTGSVNGITLTGTVTSSGSLTLGGTLSNVSLATQITGTLAVGNGGTGVTTLTGLAKGNGTSAFSAAVAGTDYLDPAAIGTTVQAYDADLSAIAALSGTSGLLRKTAADTWSLDTSSYLTANQTITLSGDVTGSGSTSISTTIANGAVSTAKLGGDITTAGKALLDDIDAAAQRTTLGLGTLATQNGTFSGTSSGTNTGDQNLFQTIAVAGQSDIVADSTTDTLTLVAGSNITITTNATTDEITIAATGGGGGGISLAEVRRVASLRV